MIDLHIHTTCSDGKEDVDIIIKKAKEQKLEAISITDHNTCEAYRNIDDIVKDIKYKGKIITGCEFTTFLDNIKQEIHILGYHIDTKAVSSDINRLYVPFREQNLYSASVLLDKLDNLGVRYDIENIKFDEDKEYAVYPIYKEIVKYTENKKHLPEDAWGDVSNFIYKCLKNHKDKFFVDMNFFTPNISEVSKYIKSHGGVIFLPHVYHYGEKSLNIVEELLDSKLIDGIECYHSSYSKEQEDYLLDVCKKNKIHISGGTDYHAKHYENIQLAVGNGNMNVPLEIIKSWNKEMIK